MGYDMGAYEFVSSSSSPSVSTDAATLVTSSSATLNGTVNPNGTSTTVVFEYGTSTNYGSTITATQSPLTGTNSQSVSAGITGLTAGTTYHFRAKGTNSAGTTNGDDQTFTTTSGPPVTAPTVTTGSASAVTSTSATLNGTVNPNGSTTTYYFEYGTTASYGVITSSTSVGSGTSDVSVDGSITGLTSETTYHCRLVATNSVGTGYGTDQTFTTSSSSMNPTVTTGSGSGTKGKKITLPITFTNISGVDIAAISVDREYDTGILKNARGAIGPAGEAAGKSVETSDVSSGVFRVSVFSTSNNSAIGGDVVAYLTLKIDKDAPLGAAELVCIASASDTEGYAVTVNGLNGSVNVTDYDPGDCNEDGSVSIAEVQSGINMFLELNPVEDCVDVNQNGKVSIGELQKVVNNHMGVTSVNFTQNTRSDALNSEDYPPPKTNARATANMPKISIGRKTAEPGQRVSVAIRLTNATGYDVSALSTDITYDNTILTNPSVEIGPAGTSAGKSIVFSEISDAAIRIGIISTSNTDLHR